MIKGRLTPLIPVSREGHVKFPTDTEIEETVLFMSDNTLQDLARQSVRKHLKKIKPEKNLYLTISLLGLPEKMQSYLLFNTVQMYRPNMKQNEK